MSVEITGLRAGVSRAHLIIPEKVENLLVTQINDSVFSSRNELTSVTIPNSVTYIGYSVFKDCSSLTTVNWNATICPSAGSHYEPIFEGCPNLAIVNIGDNVKIIPSDAFKDCSGLTSVTIGGGVTSIGNYVFDGCSRLTSITFNGTKAQWRAIKKGPDWNYNTGNYTIHCTDGDIPK